MNVISLLLPPADPVRPAILAGDTTVNRGELAAQVTRLAQALLSAGFVKGDRIGLMAENSPFFVIAYLAIIRAGLVVVPFQTDAGREVFAQIAAEVELRAVLVSRRSAGRIKPWLE